MKKIFCTLSVLLLCGALSFGATDGRGRQNHLGSQRTHQTARPGSAARPSGNKHNFKPSTNNRPSNNRPSNNRPDNGNHNGHYNGNHNKPNHGNHNGHYRPTPPPRPQMPHHYGWYRPTPPRHWHSPAHWRPINTILGVALGSAINFSLNALLNSGYTVTSYGPNNIYVANVPMLNMIWPDAVMFYNAGGGLCGSRFVYSTPFYDMGRYNSAYASLIGGYGAPVSVQNSGSGVEATWWGPGNQFIRLAYAPERAQDGSLRYFTTLSFGN